MKFKMFNIRIKPILTKQQKQEWITALESGKYKQVKKGFHYEGGGDFKKDHLKGHCCLAVFDDINKTIHWTKLMNSAKLKNGSAFTVINDEHEFPESRDYSNVLPFIKKLPTID